MEQARRLLYLSGSWFIMLVLPCTDKNPEQR